MRSLRLLALCSAFVFSHAHAAMPVIDSANLAQMVTAVNQSLQQLQVLQQQLSQAQMMVQSVMHLPSQVTGLVPQLNLPSIINPLPGAASVMPLLQGNVGSLGSIGGFAQGILGTSQVYTPPASGWPAANLNQNATALAGIQSAMVAQMQALQTHQQALGELQVQIGSAGTVQDVAALQARIQVEQAQLQAANANVNALSTAANMQLATWQQQGLQMDRKAADDLFNATRPY